MTESERYLPMPLSKMEEIIARHGLKEQPITIRMSGCPNGCSRPYIAEIGLTGRAPGKYNLYLGGGFHGQRLNKMYLENVGDPAILSALDKALAEGGAFLVILPSAPALFRKSKKAGPLMIDGPSMIGTNKSDKQTLGKHHVANSRTTDDRRREWNRDRSSI